MYKALMVTSNVQEFTTPDPHLAHSKFPSSGATQNNVEKELPVSRVSDGGSITPLNHSTLAENAPIPAIDYASTALSPPDMSCGEPTMVGANDATGSTREEVALNMDHLNTRTSVTDPEEGICPTLPAESDEATATDPPLVPEETHEEAQECGAKTYIRKKRSRWRGGVKSKGGDSNERRPKRQKGDTNRTNGGRDDENCNTTDGESE